MTARDSGAPGPGNVWPVFAALYLAIFAFFIMLVGTSRPDVRRTAALVDSVRDAFSGAADAETDGALFVAGRSALAELAGDVQGLLRVARIERRRRGEELRLTLPMTALFAADAVAPTPAAAPLIDRIAAALGSPPGGLRLTMALTLPAGPPLDPQAAGLPAADAAIPDAIAEPPLPPPLRRAAALAATLVSRGAPPSAIAVGVGAELEDRVRIDFRFQPARPVGGAR
ncbi:MAG TPA: hypothetical protein VES39_00875 [Rhodospirillales bacterium]|nr:hypothetical protein [Rhodospirillales bacterium]